MEISSNTAVIGAMVIAFTSLSGFAAVFIRTGRLVEKIDRVEKQNESLKADLQKAAEHIAELSITIRVLQERLQYQQAALQQAHITPEQK